MEAVMTDTDASFASGSLWQGAHIRLRAVEPEDWTAFVAWNAEEDTERSLDFLRFPQSHDAVRRWVAELAARRPTTDEYTLLIETAEGVVAGGIATHHCDRRVGSWSYGVNVLAAHRGRGYATEAVRLLARYMFGELRYQKLTVGVYDFNTPSIRLHERLGFQPEGRLRRFGFSGGHFHDLLIFGLTAEEFTPAETHRADTGETTPT